MKHLQQTLMAMLFGLFLFAGFNTPAHAQGFSCPDPISVDLFSVDANQVVIAYENHPLALYTVLRLEINGVSVHQVNLTNTTGSEVVLLADPLEDNDFLAAITYSYCKKGDKVETSDELKSSAFWQTGVATIEEVYMNNIAKNHCRRNAPPCCYIEVADFTSNGSRTFLRSTFCKCALQASVPGQVITVAEVMSMNDCSLIHHFLEDKEYDCYSPNAGPCGASNKTEENAELLAEIDVAPNPCKDHVQLRYSSENEEILAVRVYDISGNIMQLEHSIARVYETEWHYNFNTSGLAPGMYIIAVETSRGSYSERVIKK